VRIIVAVALFGFLLLSILLPSYELESSDISAPHPPFSCRDGAKEDESNEPRR